MIYSNIEIQQYFAFNNSYWAIAHFHPPPIPQSSSSPFHIPVALIVAPPLPPSATNLPEHCLSPASTPSHLQLIPLPPHLSFFIIYCNPLWMYFHFLLPPNGIKFLLLSSSHPCALIPAASALPLSSIHALCLASSHPSLSLSPTELLLINPANLPLSPLFSPSSHLFLSVSVTSCFLLPPFLSFLLLHLYLLLSPPSHPTLYLSPIPRFSPLLPFLFPCAGRRCPRGPVYSLA